MAEEQSRAAPIRVLGIGGSTRAGSMSLLSLRVALKLAAEAGAETALASVRDLDLPLYNSDLTLADYPPSLPRLLDAVRASDAFLLCSPTYHGTISGAVKNTLDALEFLAKDQPRYLGGKAVGLLGYGGASAMNVITSLSHAVRTLNGIAVPTVVILSRDQLDPEAVDVRDPAVRQRLQTLVAEVIDLGRLIRQRRQAHS